MKQSSVSQSGIQSIASMLTHDEAEVKTSAIWALANMAYMASLEISKSVLQHVSWSLVLHLLQQDNPEVQVSPAQCTVHIFAALCTHLPHCVLCTHLLHAKHDGETVQTYICCLSFYSSQTTP